jgi:hypothetical protein
MYRAFNVQIINEQCPDGQKTCPVQEYLGQQQLLRPTINNSLYAPTKPIQGAEFVVLWNEMKNICANCKSK